MAPSIFIFLIGIGATLGVLGYAYHQGKQSCVSFYEAQSTANKLANQTEEIKNYKEQTEFNDQLVGEANFKSSQLEYKNAKLQEYIANKLSGRECLTADFLRELSKLRSANGKKNNTKSTK